MVRTIGRKLVYLAAVLFLVSLATFFLIELIPGDPAATIVGVDTSREQYHIIREELGLNRPLHERYFEWLGGAMTGDFGDSLVPPVQDVSDIIRARLPVTLEITILSLIMSLGFAIPIALWSAYRADGRFDRIATTVSLGAISIPEFLLGLLLIFLLLFNENVARWLALAFGIGVTLLLARAVLRRARDPVAATEKGKTALLAVGALVPLAIGLALFFRFPDLPRQGFVRITSEKGIYENLRHAFLPALVVAVADCAIFVRVLRSDLLTTLQEDYVLAARAKGMPAWRIMTREALRPSSFSLVTIAGVVLGGLIGGTVIVEEIFNLPGMGTLLVDSITAKDYKIVQAAVLVIAVFYVLANTLIDIVYTYLDPRIRRGHH